MNNDIPIETIEQRNNSDNVDSEDEVQSEEDDKIITYISSATYAHTLLTK